jgi:hypothetical protein
MTLEEAAARFAAAGVASKPLRARAATALTRCPRTAARQIGLLRVLVGDVSKAGAVLAKSPGLGCPNPDHPGHMLFPLLDAMRVAADKRVEGILGNSRRRRYGHAALLVASCVVCAQEARGRAPAMGRRAPPAVLASPCVQRGTGASLREPGSDAAGLKRARRSPRASRREI